MWHPKMWYPVRKQVVIEHPVPVSVASRWSGRVVSTLAATVLFVAVTALAQDPVVPPPPPDPPLQQSAQQTNPNSDSNNVRAVRLSDVEGKVQVFNGADPAFDQAQQNMPVVEGMRLVTGDDGRVEIQFEDGSVARVTPNSSITLTQLRRTGDTSTITVIDANTGLTYYELNGRAGQYSVRFGPNNVTPVDSSIFRINLDGNPADLAVTHGTIHVADNQSLSLDVRTNHSVEFNTQNPGQYDLQPSVNADTWDQWNSDRDQALATLEQNATTARASTGNPEDPAWNDLDYYGDWYNVPGYGMAWSPSGVSSGWDPFGVGAWGYYPSTGYTWISGYPWGWWPYHCGAWNWFDSFGWMWFPGNCGNGAFGGGWYAYSTVWRVPPGYRTPVRPKLPPVHDRPPHGPLHPQPMYAVNRGSELTQQFRTVGGARPAPRAFEYDGNSIAPAEAILHPHTTGPIGEGFTAAAERAHPEVFDRGLGHTGESGRGVYQPGHGSNNVALPPSYHPSSNPGAVSRGVYTGGGHVSAPAPAVHASAPAASGGHPR